MGMRIKKYKRIVSPPVSWMRHMVDATERTAAWDAATSVQQYNAWTGFNVGAKNLRSAVFAVRNGSTDPRLLTMVRRGGLHPHATESERSAAYKSAIVDFGIRQSTELLDFRQRHATGCSVVGCPLAPSGSDVILTLLEHDHINRTTKIDSVTQLTGSARVSELAKTRVLCCWHHFAKTRDEHRHMNVSERPCVQLRKLGQRKLDTGCQHPLHSQMPYAQLVPVSGDPLVVGFLEVSHITRGCESKLNQDPSARASAYSADLISGRAVVHCKFCHRLYSLCEAARLYTTPLTQHQYGLLLRRYPSFVQYFDIAVSDFDWDACKARLVQRQSLAAKNRKRRRSTTVFDEDAYTAVDTAHVRMKAAIASRRSVA